MSLRSLSILPRLLIRSVALALSQLWANKGRSVLTTIGIVIGVASVTAVIAALTGLQTSVLREFEAFGTNKIFIVPHRPQEGAGRQASPRSIRFEPRLFDGLLDHCPSVSQLTRVGEFQEAVRARDRSVERARIVGIEADWHRIENRAIALGRPISILDNERRRQVCVIEPALRDQLRLDRDCIGQPVYIGARMFQIVGVVEARPEGAMFGDQGASNSIYIPYYTAWDQREPGTFAIAASRSTDVTEEARAEVSFYLRRQRRIAPGDPDNFQVHMIEQYIDQFRRVAVVITLVAGGIVGISLLVGGVGIMNIMLVSVSERTREIGLRKAVGARPAIICLQFLVEAVVLCCLGGALGLALGQGMVSAVAAVPGAPLGDAYIPMWAVGLAFGFSAAVGLVFGLIPAVKAARLDPIVALRHE